MSLDNWPCDEEAAKMTIKEMADEHRKAWPVGCSSDACDVCASVRLGRKGANAKQVGGTHYQMKIQPWDFIVANDIPFLEATAIVYVIRHKRKHGREDLEKAIHYLQKAIEVYYPEGK